NRQIRVIEGSKNLGQLRQRINPYFLRRRKRDVLTDLPDMSFDTLPVDIGQGSRDLAPYSDIIPDNATDGDIEALLKRGDEHVMKLRRTLGLAKVSGSVEAIREALEDSQRKVVVFAHHHDVIDLLMADLIDYGPVKLDGRDSGTARAKAVDRFLQDNSCR